LLPRIRVDADSLTAGLVPAVWTGAVVLAGGVVVALLVPARSAARQTVADPTAAADRAATPVM